MTESPIRGNSADSQPLQATLLTRIQKLEEFIKGLTDGTKSMKQTIVEDMPFKTDILHRI